MALWLNEADVRALLPMDDLIDAMQSAVAAYSRGTARQPVRTTIELPDGFFASMPASIDSPAAAGAKLVSIVPANAAHGLPTHLATILVLCPESGALLAVMDGRFITEARTAAVSAVAARFLARKDAALLAILGSGVQARSHLDALSRVRKLSEVRCWSPSAWHRERFAAETGIRAVESAQDAVRGADVIVLATSSSTPVLFESWVRPGACVISVGACRPEQREMQPALVARARLYVDSRAGALQESGDIVLGIHEGLFAQSHIVAELGEVVSAAARGRETEDEVTIFKSLGMAVEDIAAAAMVYARAKATGRGVELE